MLKEEREMVRLNWTCSGLATITREDHDEMDVDGEVCWGAHAALAGRQRRPTLRSSCSNSV